MKTPTTTTLQSAAMTDRMHALKPHLNGLYAQWNRPEFISPDPLQFAVQHDDVADREIVGLVASSLAFGNVKQIIRSIDAVIERMPKPARWLDAASEKSVRATFRGFRHRYVTGEDVSEMLLGVKRAREQFGGVGLALHGMMDEADDEICGALTRLIDYFNGPRDNYLLPHPGRGSACKRLHLYLRWMVRSDDVDPGGWEFVSKAKLLIPVDTHMHRIAKVLGLTGRATADLRASREITAAFRLIAPEDPVRYDFALTRLGIRNDTSMDCFFAECGVPYLR